MIVSSPWPQILEFFGTLLVVGPSPGPLLGDILLSQGQVLKRHQGWEGSKGAL
jgi:hypothetical protein